MKFKRLSGDTLVGEQWESVSPDLLPYEVDSIVLQEVNGSVRWWGFGNRGSFALANTQMQKQEEAFQAEQGGSIDG